MKNVLFDMETGDPDDLITLLLLLSNPDVELRGVTCYEGSPIQIGLIKHVLNLAGKDIPVGGLNSPTPTELSPYYTQVVPAWFHAKAQQTPVQVFKEVFEKYPDTHVLTGAPLTNIAQVVNELDITLTNMTVQGGYIGALATAPLEKFKNRKEIRTYNLSNDTAAFDVVNSSSKILNLTFVTKDLCHGFMYTPDIFKSSEFGKTNVQKLLKKCLRKYAGNGKSKAMHDPLAMIYMLNPDIGQTKSISMSYQVNEKGHANFSSMEALGNRHALINYDSSKAWGMFKSLCSIVPSNKKGNNNVF